MNFSSLLWLIRGVFPNFTDRTLEVLSAACQHAHAREHGQVTPEHVLLAIAKIQPGVGCVALKNLGINLPRRISELEALVLTSATKPHDTDPPSFSSETELLLAAAKSESKALGHNYVGTEHLILGLLTCPRSPASEYLQKGGITPSKIREEVLNTLAG